MTFIYFFGTTLNFEFGTMQLCISKIQELIYKYFLGNDTFYLFIYFYLRKTMTHSYRWFSLFLFNSLLWEMTREIFQEYQKYSKSNGHMQDVTTQPLSVSWGTNFFYNSEDLLTSLLKYKRSLK